MVAEYFYDAWGNILEERDPYNSGIASANPFRYRGYYYDSETGFYYLQTRYYDPEIGRFINADDYELVGTLASVPGQLNMYAYCGNNPVMGYDPYGTWDWESIAKIALGVLIVTGLAVASIVTAGTASVVLAGATIGAGAGFVGGGVSGLVSGGGLAGFADGALFGTVTGAISGAVAASGLGVGWQMGINAGLNAGNYVVTQAISGGKITLGGLAISAGLGATLGLSGGHGWTSAAMGGKLLLADVAMNMSKNFLQHSITYLSKEFLVRFFAANATIGALSGGYSYLSNTFNKTGAFYGI